MVLVIIRVCILLVSRIFPRTRSHFRARKNSNKSVRKKCNSVITSYITSHHTITHHNQLNKGINFSSPYRLEQWIVVASIMRTLIYFYVAHLTQDTFRGIRYSFRIGHVTLWTSEAFALSFPWLVCVDRTRKTFSNIPCGNTIMTSWTDNLVIYGKREKCWLTQYMIIWICACYWLDSWHTTSYTHVKNLTVDLRVTSANPFFSGTRRAIKVAWKIIFESLERGECCELLVYWKDRNPRTVFFLFLFFQSCFFLLCYS